jgi:hydroxymethylpyrimidine pyrophosphatase-like HAD family hydrolase/energy-coupling factor transporter ATP-binding protein EcfA2
MRYVVLAADYDGTLASDEVVEHETLAALERLRSSGRKLVLVTGRQLEDLLRIFARVDLFDRIVAENGAVVYCPSDRQVEILGEAAPEPFVKALRARNVIPLSIGHVIVATWEPNETVVLQTIHDLGLELQVIFNKGAVMILPAGVNKATGLERALAQLHLSPHNAVGIGDAENDHAFLNLCECGVAVANALPTLKDRADWVTLAPRGKGVVELVDRLIDSDLQELAPDVGRRQLPIGTTPNGEQLTVSPYGTILLIAGPSGTGKSTIATAILEQLVQHHYQFCLIDPEGDYAHFEDAIVLGDSRTAPTIDEVLDVLQKPSDSVVAVLLGLGLDERPLFFDRLMTRIQGLRAEKGRPHWVVLDEAHHLLPVSRSPLPSLSGLLGTAMVITVHPDHVSTRELSAVNVVLAVGAAPLDVVQRFASAVGAPLPPSSDVTTESGEPLVWFRKEATGPVRFRPAPPHGERLRHRRKYAEGTLGPDKSFYFRGPEQKLHLRSQNLGMFLQLADGVDDETWLYHLRLGEYSRWVRDAIKDDALADEIAAVEAAGDVSAADSRAAIAEAISRRYTHPG